MPSFSRGAIPRLTRRSPDSERFDFVNLHRGICRVADSPVNFNLQKETRRPDLIVHRSNDHNLSVDHDFCILEHEILVHILGRTAPVHLLDITAGCEVDVQKSRRNGQIISLWGVDPIAMAQFLV